jgi:hypothetical protein
VGVCFLCVVYAAWGLLMLLLRRRRPREDYFYLT